MAAGRLSHFPMFFRDYLLSKTRLKMTAAQRGAYIDILCLCYDSEDGCIEWDTEYLVALTGTTKEDITTVQRVFNDRSTGVEATSNGRWTHPRVQAELGRMAAQFESASRGGKSSAAKRLGKGVQRPFNTRSTTVQPAEHSKALLGARPQAGTLAAPLPAPSGSPSATPKTDTRTQEQIDADYAKNMAAIAEIEKSFKVRR